jgi:type I restriction enzyme, S subunit
LSELNDVKLPVGWTWARLAEIVEVLDNQRVPVSAKERAQRPGGVPYYGATGQVGWIDTALFNEDLILLGEDGVQFFDHNKPKAYRISGPAWVNNHAHVLRAREGATLTRFITHYLNSFNYEGYANGTTRLKLTKSSMCSIPVPLPPFAEQHRIVEAIEDHLSRLDSASHSLAHAQALIPIQRRALHTAATEGRLSAAHNVDIVPDFLTQRRKFWTSTHNSKKYKEPVEPDLENVPVRPEGWKVFSLEALTDPIRIIRYGILMPRVESDGKVPYVEVKDLKDCSLHGKRLHLTSNELDEQFAGARVAPGDVLLAVRGSYDRSAVVPPGLRGANISRDVARIAPLPGIDSEYLHLYLQSDFTQRYLRAHARGVAVKGVNIASIRALPVAIPSLAMQRRIVEEVQQQLTVIDIIEKAVHRSSRRGINLRRALLSHAFNGRLVQQDPASEPASVLLDRIRAEDNVQGQKSKPKRVARGPRKIMATTDAPPPSAALTTAVQQELPL